MSLINEIHTINVTSNPAWSKRNFILVASRLSKLASRRHGLALALIILCVPVAVVAQDIDVQITIDDAHPSVAHIEGHVADKAPGMAGLSFLQNYAGVLNLADRITGVQLADADKRAVWIQAFATRRIPRGVKFFLVPDSVELKQSSAFAAARRFLA